MRIYVRAMMDLRAEERSFLSFIFLPTQLSFLPALVTSEQRPFCPQSPALWLGTPDSPVSFGKLSKAGDDDVRLYVLLAWRRAHLARERSFPGQTTGEVKGLFAELIDSCTQVRSITGKWQHHFRLTVSWYQD